MKIRNVLRIAFVAIRRNAVRSALTMLGVIIGVASVIAMISLGSGARASIDEQIQQQGTNVIYVSSAASGAGQESRAGARAAPPRSPSTTPRSSSGTSPPSRA